MNDEEAGRIQKIMSQTKCDNDFRCHKSEFKDLCKATVVGNGLLVDCSKCDKTTCPRSENKPCSHRIAFGFGHFCTCPVRIYAAQHPCQ